MIVPQDSVSFQELLPQPSLYDKGLSKSDVMDPSLDHVVLEIVHNPHFARACLIHSVIYVQ